MPPSLPLPTGDAQSPIAPMEAKSVAELPSDPGWQFEPKWDGFRCLAFRSGGDVRLFAKSGKPLQRSFPEVAAAIAALDADEFVIDGELVISDGDHHSFEALQMRLHPAESRIRKLAREIPAHLVAFDMLVAPGGAVLTGAPLIERRAALEAFVHSIRTNPSPIVLSPMTRDRAEAERWLAGVGIGGDLDGIVAKRLDGPYQSGGRAMRKVKRIRTADCVVGGFRYGTGSALVGSLLLGLYDAAERLNHVGYTSSIAQKDKPALTQRLEAMRGEGFTGNAPGGPSRWSTERTEEYVALRPELVVEVSYDHMSGGRFRHGTTLLRWRPDKAPAQCTYEQLG